MTKRHEITARFWEWLNDGWVKITLRPGRKLRWYRWQETEDGWGSEEHIWEYAADEGLVYENHVSDGCDCDGRLTQSWVRACHISRLASHWPGQSPGDRYYCHRRDRGEKHPMPHWHAIRSRQYDQYAAAMGY